MTNATLDRIKRALKDHQPAALSVVLSDGERRELAPGGKRAKWTPVLAALSELPWVTLECHDARGRLLGPPIQNDGSAEGLETIGMTSAVSARVGEASALLQVLTRASKEHLGLLTSVISPTLDSARKLTTDALTHSSYWREEAERQRARADAAEQSLRALERQIVELAAEAEADGKTWADGLAQLASAAPHLMHAVTMGVRMLRGGGGVPPPKPAAPPPGAKP